MIYFCSSISIKEKKNENHHMYDAIAATAALAVYWIGYFELMLICSERI